jgi:ubiquitin C-terminal hydrolase
MYEEGKGYTGLANLGNTCFLNACIQIINHTYEFNHFLQKNQYPKNNIADSVILNEWNELNQLLWKENGVISPNKFVHHIQQIAKYKQKDLFTGWGQNDMSEFLLFFMDCIHNSIARTISVHISGTPENTTDQLAIQCYTMLKNVYTKEYSEVMEWFYGIYVSEIISMDGNIKHSIKPEHYFILDLPVVGKNHSIFKNIYECLDHFISPEILEGENAWYNETTKEKERVKKQMTFWNFPNILVMTFKRFSPDGSNKITSLIEFPMDDLQLTPYISGYSASKYIYELYGVCNHIGTPYGGHYTSFVRNYNKEWIHYNDTNVERINDMNQIVSNQAYCLFYRRKG